MGNRAGPIKYWRGHVHGRAEALDPGFSLGVGERAAQDGLFFFELGFEVGAELGDDVVLPLPGQVFAHRFEIAVEEFHIWSFADGAGCGC
jgi:hypothetical protein